MNSPNCCETSKSAGTITLFVPQGATGATWNAPMRVEGELVTRCTTPARFCPFCGVRLTVEHLAFEATGYLMNETHEEWLARNPAELSSSAGPVKP